MAKTQLNPIDIKESSTNGDVLKTVDGKTQWSSNSGGTIPTLEQVLDSGNIGGSLQSIDFADGESGSSFNYSGFSINNPDAGYSAISPGTGYFSDIFGNFLQLEASEISGRLITVTTADRIQIPNLVSGVKEVNGTDLGRYYEIEPGTQTKVTVAIVGYTQIGLMTAANNPEKIFYPGMITTVVLSSDSGNRMVVWGNVESFAATPPAAGINGKIQHVEFKYDASRDIWMCMSVTVQGRQYMSPPRQTSAGFTFNNSWKNFSADRPCKYLVEGNTVHLIGLASKGSAWAANEVIATLPSQYWPRADYYSTGGLIFQTAASGTVSSGTMMINPANGQISARIAGSTDQWISMYGVSFLINELQLS